MRTHLFGAFFAAFLLSACSSSSAPINAANATVPENRPVTSLSNNSVQSKSATDYRSNDIAVMPMLTVTADPIEDETYAPVTVLEQVNVKAEPLP